MWADVVQQIRGGRVRAGQGSAINNDVVEVGRAKAGRPQLDPFKEFSFAGPQGIGGEGGVIDEFGEGDLGGMFGEGGEVVVNAREVVDVVVIVGWGSRRTALAARFIHDLR